MTTGSCACGAVVYEITGPPGPAHHCHCRICRKTHAAAFSTFARLPRDRFRLVRGEERVRRFRSSAPCERRFCGDCGSHLQFLVDGLPDLVWVSVGTMDGEPPVEIAGHMFVPSKASWYDIRDDLPRWDEYPPEP